MAGLAAFQGVEQSTDAQKAALSKMIAEQGSAGAEAFKGEAAVAAAAGQAGSRSVMASNPGIGNPAASSAVGPGALTKMLSARAAEPGQTNAALSTQAGNDFSAYSGLLGQANGNYMDAVKGAAPIVESQTRAQVSQILADLAQKREAQRQESQDREEARRQAEEDRKWELTKRGWEVSDRNAKLGINDPHGLGGAQAADKIGLSKEEADKVMGSGSYGQLMTAAGQLMQNFPDMDAAELQGHLVAATKAVDKDGNPVMQADPRALALVMAQMSPYFGLEGTLGTATKVKGYHSLGQQTPSETKRSIAYARHRAY